MPAIAESPMIVTRRTGGSFAGTPRTASSGAPVNQPVTSTITSAETQL